MRSRSCKVSPATPMKRKRKEFVSEAQRACFDAFYAAYWLKKARADAEQAYIEKVTSTGMHRKVMKAVQEQTPEMMALDPHSRPYPATWLRAERWTDEVVTPRLSRIEQVMEAI